MYGDYRWDIQAIFYLWLSEYALKIIAQQKVKGAGYNAHLISFKLENATEVGIIPRSHLSGIF